MKRVLLLILCGVMLFSITGCDKKDEKAEKDNNSSIEKASTENVLLGTWTGKDEINRDTTWIFKTREKVFLKQYNDLTEKEYSWQGTYEVNDDKTVTINFDNWPYERVFRYEISSNQYLNLINITEEQDPWDFPDFNELLKK